MAHAWWLPLAVAFAPAAAATQDDPAPQEDLEAEYDRYAKRPPDHVQAPILADPAALSAAEAEQAELVAADHLVIGVRIGESARAYPMAVIVERKLVLDHVEGVPIAVSS